jgi:hypothetical protein
MVAVAGMAVLGMTATLAGAQTIQRMPTESRRSSEMIDADSFFECFN